ncbi:MAG: di-trans,poly-cis-decaprenylcistransferase, partial [Gemmatimonadetes bacterium]|nr:di-trans,poly-cis-decaprenylcistransferase [Gemmatimonadota bacterium]
MRRRACLRAGVRRTLTEGAPELEQLLERVVAGGHVPKHIAIIMDGNGRWAGERGLPRFMGHREGMKSVRRAVTGCLEMDVQHVTLYAFSKENWSRPPDEIAALMRLLSEYVDRERKALAEKGVRVRVIGDRARLSPAALQAVESIEGATAGEDTLVLNLAISYGSRDEILSAARSLARRCVAGEIDPDDIDEADFASALYTTGSPDPDLLIRTSGEMRVSNFLLWQIAYSEIHVTECLWPDFGERDLYEAVLD